MKTLFGRDTAPPLSFGGYQSGSIEFATVFNEVTGPELRGELDALVEAAATAESGLLPGAFVSIVVVGHADRVDVAGATPEERRALELENSGLRAESALAFVFNRIADRLQQEGATIPNDVESLQAVDLLAVAAGSAKLEFPAPGNNEAERMANRRVEFFGVAFFP